MDTSQDLRVVVFERTRSSTSPTSTCPAIREASAGPPARPACPFRRTRSSVSPVPRGQHREDPRPCPGCGKRIRPRLRHALRLPRERRPWPARGRCGVIPGGGGTERLPRLTGRGRALEIILDSDDFAGDTAERYGWFNRSVNGRELDGFVDSLARRLASFDRRPIEAAKNLVDRSTLPSIDELLDSRNAFATALTWPETQKRVAALFKRGMQQEGDLENRFGAHLADLSVARPARTPRSRAPRACCGGARRSHRRRNVWGGRDRRRSWGSPSFSAGMSRVWRPGTTVRTDAYPAAQLAELHHSRWEAGSASRQIKRLSAGRPGQWFVPRGAVRLLLPSLPSRSTGSLRLVEIPAAHGMR